MDAADNFRPSWLAIASISLAGLYMGTMAVYLLGWQIFLMPLAVVAAAYVGIIVHEAGHIVGCLTVGYGVDAFSVWPFHFFHTPSGWRTQRSVRGAPLGFVVPRPVGRRAHAARIAFLTAMGPLASFALAYSCFRFDTDSSLILHTTGITSAAMGVISLLPFPGNDGGQLLSLVKGGIEAKRQLSLVALSIASKQGRRPRDWDARLIADAAAQPDSSPLSLLGQGFHYNWLLENLCLDEAEEALMRLIEKTSSNGDLWTWRLECVWFYARFRHDHAAAAEWLKKATAESTKREGHSYCKACAAVAFLENRLEESAALARNARAACEPMTDLGLRHGMLEEIDALLSDIAARR